MDPEQDLIVYVNNAGVPTGKVAPKLEAHNSNTRLHSAFSCYIFNEKGQFLVTQRAYSKKVWPGVWTNSVCGHPAPGESRESAIERRTEYELGMKVRDIKLIIPDYTYKTPPFNGIIEHEYCPVFVALKASDPNQNSDEVEEYTWVQWDDFVTQAKSDTNDTWSWWCKDQLKLLENNQNFKEFLASLTKT